MRVVRRAPYNRQVIVWERWRVPYAPAYGWRWWWHWKRTGHLPD